MLAAWAENRVVWYQEGGAQKGQGARQRSTTSTLSVSCRGTDHENREEGTLRPQLLPVRSAGT